MGDPRWEEFIHIEENCFFTREQLVDPDYDPIEAGDVDLDYLQERFQHHINLDHAAAVRGILVREEDKSWKWIWGIGLLHDHIFREAGYARLYGRYRNQVNMLPRIEFHGRVDIEAALGLLLETTPIEKNDVINIENESGGRWMSIGDYLKPQLIQS